MNANEFVQWHAKVWAVRQTKKPESWNSGFVIE